MVQRKKKIGVWLPAVRVGTGVDVFTVRLNEGLNRRRIKSEITWIPRRAEFFPWTVKKPVPPDWADIVHVNSWIHPRFIPENLKMVTTIHGCVHDPNLLPYKGMLQRLYHRFWVKALETANIERSDAVTAVSRYTAEISRSIFQTKNIHPIHNWIDSNRFSPPSDKKPHQPFRLLFAGKPSRRKGADMLPQIMKKLGPEFELYVTGNAEELTGSNELIPGNIIFLGRIHQEDALIRTYRESDVLLFPTRLEGSSLVVLEAQACGLPIVSTNCSSLPEVVDHEKTGLLSPVDNVDEIVSMIRRLKQDEQFWLTMCKEARFNSVSSLFDEDSALNRYILLYEKIL